MTEIAGASAAQTAAASGAATSHSLLRFLTCGSVDDGKSTLIGRMLFDTNSVPEDQLVVLERDSKKVGTTGDELDLALLVDGLQAEREQGITIDVAYRYFATPKRTFIVADTPGHEQYTRNMATGASVSELAVILIDARKGILTQTRRHSYILQLLGIQHVILAVNKMDLMDWSQSVFTRIRDDYMSFATELGIKNIYAVPLSARRGDNVINRGTNSPWYDGPTLMGLLETIEVAPRGGDSPFRFPVQWVNRPNQDFRGFSGTVAGGSVAKGDAIVVANSGRTSKVARITTHDGDLPSASVGQSVTLVLEDEVDISRGDVLASPEARPDVADQIGAHLIWLGQEHMIPGRPYLIKCGTRTATATVTQLKYKVNIETLEHAAGRALELNEVGVCNLSIDRELAFDPYAVNATTGGFILIDKLSNQTVAAGLIDFALRRSTNIHWQSIDIDRMARAEQKGQRPVCLWFTGLSGSGKSTLANLLEKRLHSLGRHTFILDGDNVRHGLCRDLGFTDVDRVENIRRASHVARLMTDAGLIVLVSFISPFRSERRMAREMFPAGEFLEIFVDTPIEECERRDVKGLYRKAREGRIANFTGVSSPYERPEHAEVHLQGASAPPEALIEAVVAELRQRGILA